MAGFLQISLLPCEFSAKCVVIVFEKDAEAVVVLRADAGASCVVARNICGAAVGTGLASAVVPEPVEVLCVFV